MTFEQARFNLVCALSNVEAKKRFEFPESVGEAMDAHLRYFKQGYELLHQIEPYIHQVLKTARSKTNQVPIAQAKEESGGIEAHSSSSVIPQTESDDDLQGAADGKFSDNHEHFGTERDIINGLRIDIDMLQQRMNDMQRILEACMGMQLELQRSVQQEVHSALNRASNSDGAREIGIHNYDCKSSHGKGVCYLCCDDGSDSLPNKSSAHMYICSKCAEKINWSKLKESVRHP